MLFLRKQVGRTAAPQVSTRKKTVLPPKAAPTQQNPVKPHKIGIHESVASFFTNHVLKPVVAVAFAAIAVITLGNIDLNAQSLKKTDYALAAGANSNANKLGDETKARGYAVKGTPKYDVTYENGVVTFIKFDGEHTGKFSLLNDKDYHSLALTPLREIWWGKLEPFGEGVILKFDRGFIFFKPEIVDGKPTVTTKSAISPDVSQLSN